MVLGSAGVALCSRKENEVAYPSCLEDNPFTPVCCSGWFLSETLLKFSPSWKGECPFKNSGKKNWRQVALQKVLLPGHLPCGRELGFPGSPCSTLQGAVFSADARGI